MRTILFTMAAWALTTPASFGQIEALEKGSAEATQLVPDQTRRSAEGEAEYKKHLETGRRLFSVDKRWTRARKGELAGTLASRNPPEFEFGDWGCTSASFQVLTKVSDTECLVLPRCQGSEVMLIRGFDMSKVTDGVEFVLQYPLVILDTFSYTAASGAKKTVLVLERSDSKLKEVAEAYRKAVKAHPRLAGSLELVEVIRKGIEARRKAEEARRKAAEAARRELEAAREAHKRRLEAALREARRKTAEDALFREWTDSKGRSLVVAKFIEYKRTHVHLERKEDGKRIEIPTTRLSKQDQEWIHDELKRRKEERSRRDES